MPYKDQVARRESMRSWQRKNKDKINAYNRARYAENPEAQRQASIRWRKSHRLEHNEKCRLWMNRNRKRLYNPKTNEGRNRLDRDNSLRRQLRSKLKLEVLSYYGLGILQCRWPKCEVSDIDLLTLDHVNNNGAEHRKIIRYKSRIYALLKRDGFPNGYQTLCWNHQMKKEIERQRHARISTS